MLAPIFFSTNVELASFGAFAAGFFSRPLGAIVFGMMGDKAGRRLPLIYSMTLIGIPTILIGLIPSYQSMGVLSPCFLILCRALQGFFNGGEFAGVNLFIAESENKNNIGASAGLLISIGVFGAVFAAITGAIATLDVLPSWSWRLPFIVGGLLSMSIIFAARHLQETTEFHEYKQIPKTHTTPWRIIIDHHKLSFVCSIMLCGFTLVPLYLATIFGNQIFSNLGYSHSESMSLNSVAMVIDGLAIGLFGKLSDRIGFRKQINLVLIFALIAAIPAFYIISIEKSTIIHAFLFIMPLVLIGGIAASCAFIYSSKLFPIDCRYSALALSVTLGQALFGGTTPFVASYLVSTWNTKLAPAFWLIFVSVLTLVTLKLKKRQELRLTVNSSHEFEKGMPTTKTAA